MGLLGRIFGGGPSLGSLQLRVIEKERDGISGLIVQCKGPIPFYPRKNLGFIVSLLCETKEKKLAPVLSMIDTYKEAITPCYQFIKEIGVVDGPIGYPEWGGIAPIFPEIIQPAYGGRQSLSVIVRLVDLDDPPQIMLGSCNPSDCIWTESTGFTFDFEIKGYKESLEDKQEARVVSVKIGVAVAMADEELADSEDEALNSWIKKIISPYDEDQQESLKNIYNSALKESYKLAESGNLNLTDICKQMNKVAETPQKHEALELAHEVMAADGDLDKREIKMIHKIATLLEFDATELENIRDKQLVSFKPTSTDDDDPPTGVGGGASVESLLGIDPTWSNKKILALLDKEFVKWNARLNTLPEGKERDNAQHMLDLIAEARKKYDK